MSKGFTSKGFEKWFNEPGAYVLVDGQFGSTGKGLIAGYMSWAMHGKVNKITTNAGPNSGHTAYIPNGHLYLNEIKDVARAANITEGGPIPPNEPAYDKIMTQQLPVAAVFLDKMGHKFDTILNAGAVIDPDILLDELGKWVNGDGSRVLIHPNAAIIDEAAKASDRGVTKSIAGTGKGIGPAMARKLMRLDGTRALVSRVFNSYLPVEYQSWDYLWDWRKDVVFVETAQGFSLGLNTSRFYPCVTSRECTVMQALSDARIPAQMLKKVVCTFRTYPIRVGSTENTSGGWYPDQWETTWEKLGLSSELTTVTKRVRRVASWSDTQYVECLETNRPDVLFLNFCNYLSIEELRHRVRTMLRTYVTILGRFPDAFLLGFGPLSEDVHTVQDRLGCTFQSMLNDE